MRLDLDTARVTNVNLAMEPGYVWLTVTLPQVGHRPSELRAFRLDPEQLKELLTNGAVWLPEGTP